MMTRPPTILFADRDPAWSREARVVLRGRGAKVATAASVDDALRMAAHAPPDLVFLDDDLPGREDRDLEALFRSAMPDARIVLLGPRPLASETVLDLAADALGGRLRESGPPLRLGTVLCVDDDPVYLRSICRLLSRHGYRVSAFEDADRALEAIPRLKPDVAIVDIMMPGMGGLDLAARIDQASHGKVPVVFVTGLDSDEAFYEGHQHGRFVVEKTDAPEKVLDVVDSLAGGADRGGGSGRAIPFLP
jgi:CheY-like chemotaxis protein